MSRASRASKVNQLGGLKKKKKSEAATGEIDIAAMAALAPREVQGGMLGTLLKTEQSIVPEVKLTIDIKEFKFGNKKVANSEVITIHKGNKTNVSVPFSKALDFTFAKVENDMVFKFAVTGSGDLLGFIYLEIPKKFRTIKSFKLDDWFPVKQIDPEEDDEIVRVENFLARIMISYKATRKLELLDYFPKNIPQAKVFQLMAQNLKSRLNTINKDMRNFSDQGFKYLHDFETRILKKRINMRAGYRSPVKHKNLNAKEYLNQQQQVFIKSKPVAVKNEYVQASETRFTDYYNKEGGKYKMRKDVNPRKAIEELTKELTLAKKELADRNTLLRSMEEEQMTPENIDLKREIEQMKDDLQRDKGELTVKIVDATKELNREKQANKEEHDQEMGECRDLKNEIDQVMDDYKKKYKELQKLEDRLKKKADDNEELSEQVRMHEARAQKERDRLDREKETLDELEVELDKLRNKMMKERHKIYKKSKNFDDERGGMGIKERQLRMQEDFLRNQREDFEDEKAKAYKELAQKEREIDEISKLGGLDEEEVKQLQEEHDERLKEVEEAQKKNKMEGVKLWREKTKLEEEIKEFLTLKKIADEEKAVNQKSLEDDYDFIDEQMSEMDNRKRELDELKKGLENFEVTLQEAEQDFKDQVADFNNNKDSFFTKMNSSSMSPSSLRRIAREHGINPDAVAEYEAEQKAQEQALNAKKNVVRTSIMGLNNPGAERNTIALRRQTTQERRSTMVNRMSMTGGDLTALNFAKQAGPQADVNKFCEGIFNNACSEYIKAGKKTTAAQIEELTEKLADINGQIKETKLAMTKAKLAKFLKNVLNVLAANAEKQRLAQEQKEQEEREKREREEKERKRKQDEEDKRKMEELSKKQQMRFLAEKKKREEAEKKKKAKEEKERKRLAKEKAQKAKGKKGGGLMGALGGVGKKDENADLKKDLLRICDGTIDQLEIKKKEAEANEDPEEVQKIQERIDFLKGGKKCIDNIFGIALFLDKNKGPVTDEYLRRMEKENPDFDFETIRKKYESKIKALVEYIKQIRSNYNFFNFNIDRNIMLN
jgi:DNA repair exonuclease SbcCD ATPase subunit